MDVYIGIRQQVLVRLVVEAGSYLRWWHWYEYHYDVWRFCGSRYLPVEVEGAL
jgi:hypothetical protein